MASVGMGFVLSIVVLVFGLGLSMTQAGANVAGELATALTWVGSVALGFSLAQMK